MFHLYPKNIDYKEPLLYKKYELSLVASFVMHYFVAPRLAIIGFSYYLTLVKVVSIPAKYPLEIVYKATASSLVEAKV